MSDVTEEKKCSQCGKRLRTNNKTGVCTPCQKPGRYAGGKAKPRAAKPDAGDDAVLGRAGLAKPPPTSDAVKRFRVVAEALGFDADELLGAYCEGWLAAVRLGVQQVEAPEAPVDE